MIPLLLSTALAAPPQVAHTTFELDNGLQVVLAPDPSAPVVAVDLSYGVGSRDEAAGLTGYTHLVAQLMSGATPDASDEGAGEPEPVYAGIHAATDRTRYHATLPADQLPLALLTAAHRMRGPLEALDQARLDSQRELIRAERQQRSARRPDGAAHRLLAEALYPASHPYHHLPTGPHDDVAAASLNSVRSFFHTWFGPGNATLVVTGDFDPAATRRAIEEQLGPIPGGPLTARATAEPASLEDDLVLREFDDVGLRRVWVTWHSPARLAPGDAALELVADVLTGGEDARLTQELVHEQQLASSVRATQRSADLQSSFQIEATAATGHTTDELAEAIFDVIDDLIDAPPEEDELAGPRAQRRGDILSRLSSAPSRADQLSNYLRDYGDAGAVDRDLARYDVEDEDVRETIRDVFRAPSVTLHLLPEADRGLPVPTPPPPPPDPRLQISTPQGVGAGVLLALLAALAVRRLTRGDP
jgi:zinc protease